MVVIIPEIQKIVYLLRNDKKLVILSAIEIIYSQFNKNTTDFVYSAY